MDFLWILYGFRLVFVNGSAAWVNLQSDTDYIVKRCDGVQTERQDGLALEFHLGLYLLCNFARKALQWEQAAGSQQQTAEQAWRRALRYDITTKRNSCMRLIATNPPCQELAAVELWRAGGMAPAPLLQRVQARVQSAHNETFCFTFAFTPLLFSMSFFQPANHGNRSIFLLYFAGNLVDVASRVLNPN